MKTSQFHTPSFLAFLLFATWSAFTFLIVFIVLLVLLVSLASGSADGGTNVLLSVVFTSQTFIGILLGTAAVISALRFMNKPFADATVSTSVKSAGIVLGVIATGVVLLIGRFTQSDQSVNWVALSILTVPAAAIPIWLLFRVGTKAFPPESNWRIWSTFGISLSLTGLIAIILEIMVLIFAFIIAIIFITANPELTREFELLSNEFLFIDPNSDQAIRLIVPYLTKPVVLITSFSLFSIIIPFIEEAIKPLGVWLLAGKLKSESQGFFLGAIGGAGFALFESLNAAAQTDGWSTLLFARIGTNAMHITASALIGGAIYAAFHEKRYLRLLSTYLLSVFLHGLWNFIALTNGFSSLLVTYGESARYQTIETISYIAMAALSVGLIAILIKSNRRLQKPILEEVQAVVTDENNLPD